MKKIKSKWKKGEQKLVVLIEVNKKVFQVDLDEEKMKCLLFFLPQLFSDRVIRVIDKELPITIPNYTE